MADSKYWRRPGRRDAERKPRLRDGLTQKALAKKMGVAPVVASVVGRSHFASASTPAELSALIRS